MFAIVQNGRMIQVIQPDTQFTIGDKQYSANFIRNSSPQEKLEAGVWEIIQGVRADDRYYWVSGPSYHVNEVNSTVEATYPATPKDVAGVQKTLTTQVNQSAYSILFQSDWMVIKATETSTPLASDWAAFRAEVRTVANDQRAAIAAATTIAELEALPAANWPNDPNYVAPVQEAE